MPVRLSTKPWWQDRSKRYGVNIIAEISTAAP